MQPGADPEILDGGGGGLNFDSGTLVKLFAANYLSPTPPSPPRTSRQYILHTSSIRFPGSGKFGVRCFQKYCYSFNSEVRTV